MLKRVSILAVVALLATATVANAFPPLAEWTFEVSIPTTSGPHAAEGGLNAGAGSPASGSHVSGATVFDNPVGNGSAESFSSNNWAVGDYYQFCTSTIGYMAIQFAWDHVGSGTGPRDFDVQYNVNGGSYTVVPASAYQVRTNASPAWTSGSATALDSRVLDLSLITALDNQNQICIRLVNLSTVSTNGGTVASGGTSRVDNVGISGTEVPEPTTLALMSLGVIGLIRRRR